MSFFYMPYAGKYTIKNYEGRSIQFLPVKMSICVAEEIVRRKTSSFFNSTKKSARNHTRQVYHRLT